MKNEQKGISRADFLRAVAVISTGFVLDPLQIFAQTSPVITIKNEAAKANIAVHALRKSIYMLEGSGGNIAVFIGNDGTLMVDSGLAASQKKIIAAIAGLTPRPLKYLVNTHWHFDHTDGNEWVHNQGATIIAHQNTRDNLSATVHVKDWNYTFPPAPKVALPEVVVEKGHTMKINGSQIQMTYDGPSHTDGDISVYFSEADVAHLGDTWWNGYYPFIDHSSGGSLDGMISAADVHISRFTDKTLIIPGHGPVGKLSQLVEFRDMMVSIKENVIKLKRSGMTLQEAILAKPTARFDDKWGNFLIKSHNFTSLVYADV